MKQLNNPLSLALIALCFVFYSLHCFKPLMSDGLLIMNSLVLAFIVGFIRYVTQPVKSAQKNHPDLPKEALQTLRESLHHSQMTLYFTVMQPMLAAQFSKLVQEIVGKKPNGEPITRFDETVVLLQRAFQQLTASHTLYNKRAFEERDRALTMLVFLRLLWQKQPADAISGLLKSIPVKLYSLLRGDAYRLYDLPLLFTQGQLVINADFTPLLSNLEGFFQTTLKQPSKEQPVIKPVDENEGLSLSAVAQEKQNHINTLESVASRLKENVIPALVQDTMPVNTTIVETDYLPDFLNWLIKRIASGNKQFAIDNQELVLCDSNQFDNKTIFLMPEVLAKYQSRSGIEARELESALQRRFFPNQAFYIEKAGDRIAVFPCILDDAFDSTHSTHIVKGDYP